MPKGFNLVLIYFCHSQGALVGAAVSIFVSMYVAVRAQSDISSGELSFISKPTSVEGCSYSFPEPNITAPFASSDGPFQFHHISYMFYSFLGTLITVVVGFIVTIIDGDTDPSTVELRLLAPFLRKYFTPTASLSSEITLEMTKHVFGVKDNQVTYADNLQKNEKR